MYPPIICTTNRRIHTSRRMNEDQLGSRMDEDDVDEGGCRWTTVDEAGRRWTKLDDGGRSWTKVDGSGQWKRG
jgi:hypothetical protein